MAFTDFSTFSKFNESFPDIAIIEENFIPSELNIFEYAGFSFLENEIKDSLKVYRSNEQFISLFIIAPILKAIWMKFVQKLNLWTDEFIKADEKLVGRPDFLISGINKKQYILLTAPMLAVVEAKKEQFEQGWGQCAAEMLACQKINNKSEITIFGAVTTGKVWEFGKLYQNMLTIHTIPYSVGELQKLLNILNYFFEEVEKQLPLVDTTIILNTE